MGRDGDSTPLKGCVITISGDFAPDRTVSHYSKWIPKSGGIFQKERSKGTTHFVVSDTHWAAQTDAVKAALLDHSTHVVSEDWLNEALQNPRKSVATKKIAARYDLKKKSPPGSQRGRLAEVRTLEEGVATKKRKAKDQTQAPFKLRKGTAGAALLNEIGRFLPPQKEDQAKAKPSTGLLAANTAPVKAAQAAIKRSLLGARLAKDELLSENYHIYEDETGFEYDIVLTKVQVEFNVNQTAVLRLYESDETPQTYAVSELIRGSFVDEKLTTPCATGANKATALRTFRKQFHLHTGFEWDERGWLPNRKVRQGGPADAILDGPLRKTGKGKAGKVSPAVQYKQQIKPKKVMSEDQKRNFKAQKFEWRNPPQGQPQGTFGPPALSPAVDLATPTNAQGMVPEPPAHKSCGEESVVGGRSDLVDHASGGAQKPRLPYFDDCAISTHQSRDGTWVTGVDSASISFEEEDVMTEGV